MSKQMTASQRMTRLLAVIPWVVEQDGAALQDIVDRFDYPRTQLVDDLTEVVFFVGVHPFTPDSMIEVEISDDRVQIRYADWFSRPLRLTPTEGARLLTAGRSALSLTEEDEAETEPAQATPLLRALAKLEMALGEEAGQAVEVRLGRAPSDSLNTLREAVSSQLQVEIEYYTFGRDELTTRLVDPAKVFSDHGNWYLHAWCHRAEAERVFRVDRMRSARMTDQSVSRALAGGGDSFTPGQDDPRVDLRLHPDAAWVVEQYPTESVDTDADDHLRVRMAVTATPWLERLLLRLGRNAEVVAADPPLATDLVRGAAARVLARYST